MLSAADYPVEADGLMGPLTRKAIRGFQVDSGLDVDGIPGPKTLAALRRAIPFGAGGAGIWNRVVRFLAALFGRS
jgi:peptidoglycan hydrolase-like protein with peptidoglycan-binding domain